MYLPVHYLNFPDLLIHNHSHYQKKVESVFGMPSAWGAGRPGDRLLSVPGKEDEKGKSVAHSVREKADFLDETCRIQTQFHGLSHR